MRPGISELLGGACRILEDVIAPELASAYPAEVLQGVVRTLRALEGGWAGVPAFIAWDNAATEALLQGARAAMAAPLTARVDAELAQPAGDPLSPDAAVARNDRLRALLADAVREIDAARPELAEIARHLEDRARRFPIRLVAQMPRRAGADAHATTAPAGPGAATTAPPATDTATRKD